jgi:hypothetical protein
VGIPLRLGHDFTHSGNETDCFNETIVRDGYWQRMGGGNALDGRTIQLDHRTYGIIGVLSPGVALDDLEAFGQPSILTPIGCDTATHADSRGESEFLGIARLKPGVTMSAALENLVSTQKNISRALSAVLSSSF